MYCSISMIHPRTTTTNWSRLKKKKIVFLQSEIKKNMSQKNATEHIYEYITICIFNANDVIFLIRRKINIYLYSFLSLQQHIEYREKLYFQND